MSETETTKPERSRTAKWTRRGFIGAGVLAGGALLIGVGVRSGNPVGKLKPLVAGDGEELVNSWVKIDTDNTITAIVPHCEMGQGAHSVLAQMLADELDADWDKVKVMQAPTDGNYVVTDTARMFVAPFTMNAADWIEPTYDGLFTQIARFADVMITGGSSSIRSTGQYQMRVAGAAAREMLVGAAADSWGVPPSEIATEDSMLIHTASGKRAPYAKFAAAAADQAMPQTPALKDPKDFRLMGKSKARTDIPPKVNGTANFGIDAKLPEGELTYAAVRRRPVPGTMITAMDAGQAKSMPGVLQILNMGDFVAVVADSYWQAQQALGTITTEYSEPESPVRSNADQFAAFTAALDGAGDEGGDKAANKGDAVAAFGKATTTLEAEYKVPFLAHAPMEPVNCTAWVRETDSGDKCDVWTSTQVPLMARSAAAGAIGLDAGDITVHHPFLGGAFGRRLESDYVTMAVRIAKATGYPVKMIWSREEDTQKAMYRPADISRFKGGLDADGRLVSYNNVFTQRHDPAEACVPAFYDIANTSVRVAEADLHLPFSAWRSVDHSQHGFFIESFIDEAAHAAGKDPVAFRLAMLDNAPRHKAVLEKVAELSDWDSAGADGTAKGVAIVESFGTIAAQVIEVDMNSGKPRMTKVWAVTDPGFAMNPDGFRNQIEGGIVFALTAALYGELDLVDGAVQQSNFHDYKMLRMDECPDIDVAIINSGPVPIGGAGEPGVPPAAPALTNAIFAATGTRIRELPIAKQFA
ncbi:xanthine dehydrogenase family protein molybdopterin-binding subunit [Parerythrobacter jejuensis]|uniref:Molybdopterin-dependent oxidoreductase n=1 Tax=Parerythrobacter jejuensis TaxID=795812 RepID=A0A845AN16_9SPHN|nr:molybdopterin cofactor-binding domain-containing protein [Parerythrobacter jejuensis]MXP30251.1 molybdopterin-dependent oxidoreductase [Parerythrobacter jejuensis]MXP33011.1 molybdopterin-dependent oxidoreductase [Parerythrobacter jejuensis]